MFRDAFNNEVLSYYLHNMVVIETMTLDGEEHKFWWVDPEKGRQAVERRYRLPDIEEDPRRTAMRTELLSAPQEYLDDLVGRKYAR